MRAALVSFVCLLVLGLSTVVHADVRWRASEGCPTEDEVRAEVVRLLGGAIPDDAPAVDAHVEATTEGWRLRLRIGREERRLEAQTCALLAEATSLIVALAIDPVRVVETTDTTPAEPPNEGGAVEVAGEVAGEPEVEPPADSPSLALASPRGGVPGEALVRPEDPEAIDRSRAVEPPIERVRSGLEPPEEPRDEPRPRARRAPLEGLGLMLVAGLELGALPTPAGIFGLELRAPIGTFVIEAGVHVATRSEVTASDDDSRGARLGLGLARGALSRPFALGPTRLSPRVVVELGVTGGRAFGVSDPARGLTPWAAVGLGVALDVPVALRGRVGLVVDALVPLWRPGFVVEPVADELHRAAPVVGRISLRGGLSWR